jgi:hypothetical protein
MPVYVVVNTRWWWLWSTLPFPELEILFFHTVVVKPWDVGWVCRCSTLPVRGGVMRRMHVTSSR